MSFNWQTARYPKYLAHSITTMVGFHDIDTLSDEDIKKYGAALMTEAQTGDRNDMTRSGIVIFALGKVSLSNIRSITGTIDHVRNYFHSELVDNRVCGRGITAPAMRALEEAIQAGYDIRFINIEEEKYY